jgi:hypothetical protein
MILLVSLGDAMRRCCALSFSGFDLGEFLVTALSVIGADDTENLVALLGSLISDNFFRLYFARNILERYPDLVRGFIAAARPSHTMAVFFFHAFHAPILARLIADGFDWAKLVCDVVNIFFQSTLMRTEFAAWRQCSGEALLDNLIPIISTGVSSTKDVHGFLADFLAIQVRFQASSTVHRQTGRKLDDLTETYIAVWCYSSFFVRVTTDIVNAGISDPTLLTTLLDEEVDGGCVLEDEWPSVIPAHNFAFRIATNGVQDLPELLRSACNDDQMLSLFRGPMQLLAAVGLCGAHFFARNPDSLIVTLRAMTYMGHLKDNFVQIFRMVQIVLGSVRDVDRCLHSSWLPSACIIRQTGRRERRCCIGFCTS